MLAALEQLLILQDRDRKLTTLRAELASLGPQARMIQGRVDTAKAASEASRHKAMELETERKKLELDVEGKKQQIERYSLQQYQTKKNEEYRTLAHEIEVARQGIRKIEDAELELMERIEAAQKEAARLSRTASEAKAEADHQLADLKDREENLRRELKKFESDRADLAAAVDTTLLSKYERQRRSKGERIVVGVDHGVCGGCHVRLPAQVLITCQADQELASCPNCGRILYYTRDMTLVAAE